MRFHLLAFLSLFVPALHALTVDIDLLQESFYQKVILPNVYKERFYRLIEKRCEHNEQSCFDNELDGLRKSVRLTQGSRLARMLDRRLKRTQITTRYWKAARKHLRDYQKYLKRTQFVTFVDLSRQMLMVLLWDRRLKQFHIIGSDLISSGNMEKEVRVGNGEDHYLKTPAGIFKIVSGWRSDGKVLDDGITMPYGEKGRFVFYFGWQKSIRYNTFDENGTKVEDKEEWNLIEDELALAIHAHRSTASLGRPHSHGCIRMTNEMNAFLDNNLVLHKNVLEGKKWISESADPPLQPKYYDLAGEYLIIADSVYEAEE